jgi:phosphatidylglycerol:prolipoprotein diacylglycerol transferase
VSYAAVQIDLDPNLFQAGPVLITWHGLFSVLGILAAARTGQYIVRSEGVTGEQVYDLAIWMVIVGLIGARLLFVWENFQLFAGHLERIVFLNEGGISQWGGIFGALLGGLAWCLRNRISYWVIVDGAGIANLAGFAVGRIGDVINGEHHGTPTTLPWGVEYVNGRTLGEPGKVVHPEVAYELLWCLALLALFLPLHRRLRGRLPAGVPGLFYLAVYAAGRFLLSFFRADPPVFLGLRQAQVASLVMIAVAAVAIPILLARARQGGGGEPTARPAEAAA